ncbi:putative glycosyl hydrolase ecdE, partial [Contarinia nasturtii]|uniref:putative glycosyl hydrolase ecdE n=1 Tax=Contarinia nasturtii TaxID=265458 RepID=UPI0012D3996F
MRCTESLTTPPPCLDQGLHYIKVICLTAVYDEVYRPQLHYSPPKGWLSDPNGLVYENGIYHLFFQHHPNSTSDISHTHWGHAISSDLIHWKPLDTALYPPSRDIVMFSGGAIFDHNNVTGLQTNPNVPTMILTPTAAQWSSRHQDIWLAYSNDGPEYVNFQYYERNPIIPGPRNTEIVTANRDPTVFKYHDYYVAISASYNRTKFFNSRNLLDWELVSEFGDTDGAHGGRWECPSLLPFNVTINGKQVEKYVLIITLTDFQLPAHQYFIGSYDGKKFTNENSKDTILRLDHGPDTMAGITYNNLPDGRHVLINWMGRWEYAGNTNFSAWNGQIGIPRELKLVTVNDQIRLTSLPIHEMESLRINPVHKQNISITNEFTYKIADSEKKKHLADIEMTLDLKKLKSGEAFDIVFSGKDDELKISFKDNEFILDRSRAGRMVPIFDNSTL